MIQDQHLHSVDERQLNRLINKTFAVDTMEQFVRLIGKQFASVKAGEIILCCPSAYFGPRQYCLKKNRLYERAGKIFWPKVLKRRIRSREDSLYLANELGRPFHKILALPLHSPYEDHLPAVFIEYFCKDQTIENLFNEDLWEILQSAFSKILLEEHWRTGSDLWKHTFDGLEEPLVICDEQGQPVRFNTHFKQLYEKDPDLVKKKSFQNGRDIYEKQSHPVCYEEKPYTIEHFVNVTAYLFLKEQMIINQRMSLLGGLADDVAHNLNNPLTGLLSMAQILKQNAVDQEQKENFVEIEKTALRCQKIIQNFIRFSKQSGFNEICNLNSITKETLPFLKTMMRSKTITMDLDSKNAFVQAEPCLLQQVIFNLIKNALQAVGEKGKISVQSKVDNGEVQWSITDDGCGISAQKKEQLFRPFFTTKSEGTGLGLRISRQLIEKFGGRLTFESVEGQGSCFAFYLPRIENHTMFKTGNG